VVDQGNRKPWDLCYLTPFIKLATHRTVPLQEKPPSLCPRTQQQGHSAKDGFCLGYPWSLARVHLTALAVQALTCRGHALRRLTWTPGASLLLSDQSINGRNKMLGLLSHDRVSLSSPGQRTAPPHQVPQLL